MKLYYSKGACSLAVRIVINEIGAPCEFESVDLHSKKTETGQDFLKINPKGEVPTLALDNGEILTENAVIQQYLADKYKATQVLPPLDNFQRYRVLEWLNFVSTDLHKGFGPLFNPDLPEDIKEKFVKPVLKKKLQWVDQHLSKNKYLLGDQFTLADGYLFVMLLWVLHFKMDLDKYINLSRYFSELKKRKSITQSLEQEKLG